MQDDFNKQIEANRIPVLHREETWTHPGIDFCPTGKTKFLPAKVLEPLLERLTKAPLKPQQRLHNLRGFLLARLHYKASLGTVCIGGLNNYARRWMVLPGDCPIAFYYATVADGGLGI